MRTVLFGLALCVVACPAEPTPDVEPRPDLEVVVPPSAAHPQDWLHPQIRDNPNPDYRGKPAGSLAEFVAPEVISKIVVDQYAGSPDDVRRYLTALPTAAAQYFGPSLELCEVAPTSGVGLVWTSISTVTFESGRSGRLAVATVTVYRGSHKAFGLSRAPGCVGLDKVPVDSLYVSYVDPNGYSWSFALPVRRKK
jgi:hypothetical protein